MSILPTGTSTWDWFFAGSVSEHLQPTGIAWSQVVQSVRRRPWVHFKAGSGGQTWESWFSFRQNTAAQHVGDYYRFDDYRADVRYEYNAKDKKEREQQEF